MDALGIADGAKVADIGAGAGWFTMRLARRVGPNGVVYSTDVQREMLDVIRRRVAREGLQNVRLLRARQLARPARQRASWTPCWWWTSIPRSKDRVTFLRNLATALKADGRIGIVELQAGRRRPWAAPSEGVRVAQATVEADARAAGLRVKRQREPALPVPADPRHARGTGAPVVKSVGMQALPSHTSATLVPGARAADARRPRLAAGAGRVGRLHRRPHGRGGAVQHPPAVHAGADHLPADRRAARRAGAWLAAGRVQPVPVSGGRHRRPAGLRRLGDAAAWRLSPARARPAAT